MTTAYEVKIIAIATSTINGLEGVIKRVDFVLRGTKADHIYELPESVSLSNPDPQSFKVLANVTEADVIAWVNSNHASIDGLKLHVEFMLDKQISQGELIPTPLPWATE
jgi:hypothetical protein